MEISDDDKGKSKEQAASDRRQLRKQKRYQEVIDKFDEILEALKPLVAREIEKATRSRTARDNDDSDTVDVAAAGEQTIDVDISDPWQPIIKAFSSASGSDQQRELLQRHCDVLPISDMDLLSPDDYLFVDGGKLTYLAQFRRVREDGFVRIDSAVDGRRLKSLESSTLIKLGKRDRAWRLSLPGTLPDKPAEEAMPEPPQIQEIIDDDDEVIGSTGLVEKQPNDRLQESTETAKILDKGAFSQLADAVQRADICPGADTITHVRDREFRKGNFQDALQAMEGVYGKFTAAAAGHAARLRQEDANIAAGRIKMSPRELQAKRAKDRAQVQLIERARNRFSRVVDGLRVLLRSQQVES